MIMNLPENFLFTDDHEWVDINGDVATIGITDYAQGELGDIVFIEFPDLNTEFQKGKSIGTIEAVKTVADIYMPLSGKIVALNDELNNDPSLVNNNPFDKGWMLKVQIMHKDEVSELMNTEKYNNFTS
jgi:glycine cleavage system H protein